MIYQFLPIVVLVASALFVRAQQLDMPLLQKTGMDTVCSGDMRFCEIGLLKDGKREGAWIGWMEGVRYSETFFAGGIRQGSFRMWNVSGELEVRGFYLNGEQTGRWEYFQHGIYAGEENYVNGKREGLKTEWSTVNGVTTQTEYACVENDCQLIRCVQGGVGVVANGDGCMAERLERDLCYRSGRLYKMITYHLLERNRGAKMSEIYITPLGDSLASFWEANGTQTVVGGNGTVNKYSADGSIQSISKYENGRVAWWNAEGNQAHGSCVTTCMERVVTFLGKEKYMVQLNIKNPGGTRGFVKIQEMLPESYRAEAMTTSGASFMCNEGILKFVFVSFPVANQVTVSYTLTLPPGAKGNFSYPGTIRFVLNDQVAVYNLESKDVNIVE